MNPQSDSSLPNASESLDKKGLDSHFANQGLESGPELELWEPPFERWLRLAEALLRDWPHGPFPEHRV